VKISRPVPEKPISEAMQQGKEPLRSFGDLMQFLKKTTGPEETPKPNPAPSDPPSDTPGTQAPTDTPAPGDDDVGV
jgi:hypothetical protein